MHTSPGAISAQRGQLAVGVRIYIYVCVCLWVAASPQPNSRPHMGLQPPPPTVAASVYLRLQPVAPAVAASRTYGCRSLFDALYGTNAVPPTAGAQGGGGGGGYDPARGAAVHAEAHNLLDELFPLSGCAWAEVCQLTRPVPPLRHPVLPRTPSCTHPTPPCAISPQSPPNLPPGDWPRGGGRRAARDKRGGRRDHAAQPSAVRSSLDLRRWRRALSASDEVRIAP